MLHRLLTVLGLAACAAPCWAVEFEVPVRLKADGKFVKVDAPGYACPAWADLDGRGKPSLVVGQFAGGKMKAYKYLGDLKFAAGEWLTTGAKPAEVPGVW